MSDATRGEGLRRYTVKGLQLVAVAAAYYGSAKIGLERHGSRAGRAALAAHRRRCRRPAAPRGLRMWPGIALGAFLVNVMLGRRSSVLAIAVGNTLAPVCAYLLLRRVGFRTALDRLQDALALVFLGALSRMVISATVGTGVLVAAGALPVHDFWPTWSVWWTGDAMGVLVIAPLLLAARTARWPRGAPVLRGVEAIALLGGTGRGQRAGHAQHDHPSLLVVPFPDLGRLPLPAGRRRALR